jgi:predicted DNA-binding ribbon-helix-helix protein
MRKSLVIKRSIVISGFKTSVSLEDDFWDALKEIARGQHVTLSNLVGSIDSQREQGNLSSTLRLFVLNHYRQNPGGAGKPAHPSWRPSGEAQPATGPE